MSERPGAIGVDPQEERENAFEASARVVIQFVIRAAILPYTLLRASPADIARAARTGTYRPLPSPFLLALTAGVVVSGAVSGIGVFLTPNKTWSSALTEYIAAIARFYTESTDGVEAILYAIPYVFALWLVAGIVSLFLLNGTRHAEPVFAAISLCLAALIEVFAILFALVSVAPIARMPPIGFVVLAALAYALILAWKLFRVLLEIRREHGSPRAGRLLASMPCALLVVLLGFAGAGTSWGVVRMQRSDTGDKSKGEVAAPQLVETPEGAAGSSGAGAKAPDDPYDAVGDQMAENPTPVIVARAFRP